MPTKMHKTPKQHLTSVAACLPINSHAIAILQERANQIAQVKSEVSKEDDGVAYIQFRLGKNEQYGIPFQFTKEVIQNPLITFVPSSYNFIAGVINRRGILINVIDLKIVFGISGAEKSNQDNIIIVQSKLMQVGFLVDSIKGSGHYKLEKLDPPIAADNSIKSNFIIGLHNGTLAIINIDNILMEIEARLLK